MNRFLNYNPNPKGNTNAGDCVIRANCRATGMSWEEVYKGLCNLGYQLGYEPSMNQVWKAFLEMEGFVQVKLPIEKGKPRPTVANYQNKGVAILRVAHHLVCMVDNEYFDTWDSGGKCIYTVFKKEL